MIKTCRSLLFLILAISSAVATAAEKVPFDVNREIYKAYRMTAAGEDRKALGQLKFLKKRMKQFKVKKNFDDIALLKGRILFNRGLYEQALKQYKKIPKDSELWLSAVEERAWTKYHLGQKNEVIADSHTLMSPLFNQSVGPEAFYLSAYIAHQVCDFTRVFKVIETFKKVSRQKIKTLEQTMASHKSRKTHWQLQHYSEVIKKLHLIEADSIQRIYLDKQLAGQRLQAGNVERPGPDDLQFPFDEEDVWIDEIDQLQVDAKTCPTLLKKVVSL